MSTIDDIAKLITDIVPRRCNYEKIEDRRHVPTFHLDLFEQIQQIKSGNTSVHLSIAPDFGATCFSFYCSYFGIEILRRMRDPHGPVRVNIEKGCAAPYGVFPSMITQVIDTDSELGKRVYEILVKIHASAHEFSIE